MKIRMRDLKRFNKLQDQCAAWNKANYVGCNVQVTMDSGEVRATKTRSEAEILSGHSAVIWLDGIRGCYLLDRVKRLPVVLEFEGERHELKAIEEDADREMFGDDVEAYGLENVGCK